MKSILIAAVGLFLLCAPVKADECITVDKFNSAFSSEGVKLLGSTSAATQKLAKLFNSNREANGQPKTSVSIFIFGLVVDETGGPAILAAVFDGDGCVIRKSVIVFPIQFWIGFLDRAGVTIKDFVPLDGA